MTFDNSINLEISINLYDLFLKFDPNSKKKKQQT